MSRPTGQPSDAELRRQRERIQRGLLRANAAAVIILFVIIALAVSAVVAAWRAEQSARAAQEASRQATLQRARAEEELSKSRLAEARTLRLSGRLERREKALAALGESARIHPTREARDEAVASLALLDLEEEGSLRAFATETTPYAVDAALAQYALGHTNGDVTVHRFEDGRQTHHLPRPPERLFADGQPRRLVFGPKDDQLGVVYHNGIAGVFDLAGTNGFLGLITLARSDRESSDPIVFRPDGTGAAVVRQFGPAFLYEFRDTRRAATNFFLPDLRSISFHPRTNWLAIGGYREARIVTWPDGRPIHVFTNTETVTAVCFRPDGLQLAVAAGGSGVTLWNLKSPAEPWPTHLPVGQVYELRYSPSGEFLTAATAEGVSLIWDPRTGRLLHKLTGARVIRFAEDGTTLALEQPREGVRIARLSLSKILRTFWCGTEHYSQRRLWSVDVSDDGRWLAAADNRHFIVWDIASGKVVGTPSTPSRRLSVAWLKDKRAWLTSGWKGLDIWPMETNSAGQASIGPPRSIPLEVSPNLGQSALAADGRTVAVVVSPTDVLTLDLNQPEGRPGLIGPPALGHLTFSPDGRHMAGSATKDFALVVWDVASGKLTQRIPGRHGRVAWSPDGSRLALGSDRGYTFWDTASWQQDEARAVSRGNMSDTTGALAWSPDGALLAVARERDLAQLLDAKTGRELAFLTASDAQGIGWLRFNADSSFLAAATLEGMVQLWDLSRLRQRLSELSLDWGAEPVAPALASAILKEVNSEGSSLTSFIVVTMVGVGLALGAAMFALQRQRHLLRGYLQLDELAGQRTHQLEVAQAEIIHSQKMKALGTLAAGIAHDFNNLLSVIRMSNQLTGESAKGNTDIEENVAEVEQAVQQGKKVVRSMLGYSRDDADEGGPFALPELVEDTVALLSKQFLSGIALTLELDRDTSLVRGSRSRLEQILLNLIVNAAEAMGGTGSLRISVRGAAAQPDRLVLRAKESPSYVELDVADSGPGIAPEILPRIFEPFFTTKHRGVVRGTGLGLSTVHSIAEQDGLGLAVETEPGRGTRFRVFIPVAQEIRA
jgi:signal transduction histidine kinase